jgi:hypothetical protein
VLLPGISPLDSADFTGEFATFGYRRALISRHFPSRFARAAHASRIGSLAYRSPNKGEAAAGHDAKSTVLEFHLRSILRLKPRFGRPFAFFTSN